MAHDVAGETQRETDGAVRAWGIFAVVVGCLVGVPALVVAEVEAGVLSVIGLGSGLGFALLVMVPGFALGLVALVVMLGSP